MPIFPSKYLKSYEDLICRMAAVLRIQIFQPPLTVINNVYDIVEWGVSTAITLHILEVLLQHATEP